MADDYLQLTDAGRLNTIYDPVIVSTLNEKSILRNALPVEMQLGGDKCRWVLKTGRINKLGSTTETAAIEVGHSTRVTVYTDWRIVYAGIGITDVEIAAMQKTPYSVTGVDPIKEAIEDATMDFQYTEDNMLCKGPDLTTVAADMDGLDNWINDATCPTKTNSPANRAYSGNTDQQASIIDNSGTQVDVSLDLLDEGIDKIGIAGGNCNLLVTKNRQLSAIAALLTANQIHQTTEIKGGFTALEYRGVPIIADAYIAATDYVGTDKTAVSGWNGNVYGMDTNYVRRKVLKDAGLVDLSKTGFQVRKAIGAFENLIFTSPNKSMKIVDLS